MYFELNRHPAQVPRTKIEFWGGLISDLEHCALVENLFVKKNPLQDLLDSLNSVISTNERN